MKLKASVQEAPLVTISTDQRIWSDEEFMALSKDGHRYELVQGALVDDPDEKYVLVYHCPEPDRFLRPQDSLDGEAIVPGFEMAVADLFEEWDF